MKTALVTGAAGFLGRYIAGEFRSRGWRVLGTDSSAEENAPTENLHGYRSFRLPDPAFVDWLGEGRPDCLVHCAGRASVALSMENPAEDYAGNVALPQFVLEALRQETPECAFVLLSSAAVYGNPEQLPVTEDTPIAPISPYGFHKRQAEVLCEEYASVYGMRTAILRIFSAYGPGLRRQVIWDLSRKILGAGDLDVFGTGEESRDFIHGRDVARAVTTLAENAPLQGEIYNLARGEEVSVSDLVARLLSAYQSNKTPRFDGIRRDGIPERWKADISQIEALGFSPRISLEEGLDEFARWAEPLLRN